MANKERELELEEKERERETDRQRQRDRDGVLFNVKVVKQIVSECVSAGFSTVT